MYYRVINFLLLTSLLFLTLTCVYSTREHCYPILLKGLLLILQYVNKSLYLGLRGKGRVAFRDLGSGQKPLWN